MAEALAQSQAQARARHMPKVEMAIDPNRYRSSSQGPSQGLPVTLEEVDRVIDRATRTDGWMPVIPQYQGASRWARQQWKSTVVEHLLGPCILSVTVPLLMVLAIRIFLPSARLLPSPDREHPLFATLLSISFGWGHLLTLTTFTTTFFLSHAHAFWRTCYEKARTVQGRLNDVGLLCGSHAARTPDGAIEPEAAVLLTQIARQLRLAHVLFWSDVVYRRTLDKGASFRTLLSAPGLHLMHVRGLLDEGEYATLMHAGLPPARWYLVVLEWVMARVSQARREGLIVGTPGWDATVLSKLCELRASMMAIPDELAARIPLAYVHLTSLLVDALLWLAPLALLPHQASGQTPRAPAPVPRIARAAHWQGAFTLLLCPLIVLFYSGLLELSKSFLDPFGNRRVSTTDLSAEINIDTILGEANAGSLVWPAGAQRTPFVERQQQAGASPSAGSPPS